MALAALIGTPAFAADMALKAPPAPVAPMYGWTGFYLGIEGGGGWGRENRADNSSVGCPPCVGVNHRPDAGIFGGVAGLRCQFSNNVVIRRRSIN